jgi:hypothetical protein
MPYASCIHCKASFYVKPSHVLRGWGKFCSAKCLHASMRTGSKLKCDTCGKDVYRSKVQIIRSRIGKFFCTKSCFAVWKNSNLFIGVMNGNWKSGENAYRNIIRKARIVPKCSNCGISDKRVLVVHHVDHDRKNNILSNLKWLCRNCHYLAHEGKTV